MKRFLVCVVLLLGVSSVLAAQAAGNEQRLVGTWICNDTGARWVLNANGTMSGKHVTIEERFVRYAAIGNRIALSTKFFSFGGDYFLSANGRTLIMFVTHYASPATYTFSLRRE
jgi:hypothetical protein